MDRVRQDKSYAVSLYDMMTGAGIAVNKPAVNHLKNPVTLGGK